MIRTFHMERDSDGNFMVVGHEPINLNHAKKLSADVDGTHFGYPDPHPTLGRVRLDMCVCQHRGCGHSFSSHGQLKNHLLVHKTDFREGLRRTIDWFEANRDDAERRRT